MDAEITITVIVPIYNVEKYLVQCLESIIGQSVSFDEIILINDGSTDKCRAICEKYILKYNFLKLINQDNKGLSVARNVGLKHATSEYVLFLDSDDYLRSDTVKQLKNELRKFKQDAVYFDADVYCEKGYEKKKLARDLKDLSGHQMSGESFFRRCYPVSYMISACLAVYRKEMIETAGILFPEGLYYEDNYFTFAFMMQARNVTYIPEKLYQRRYRDNSIITSAYSERKFMDFMQIVLLIWEVLDKQKNIALPKNKLFMRFINDYCSICINHRHLCIKQNITLCEKAKYKFFCMMKTYISLVERYCYNPDIIILNGILRNLKEMVQYYPESEYESYIEQLAKKVERKLKQLYKELMCDLPLGEEKCKVGIYGTGKHTEGFLKLYEKLISKVACHLVFIDSNKEKGSYLGWDVIPYRQIDNSFDLVIISSFLYEKEMIENVRNINKAVSIHTFYNGLDEDIFSEWSSWEK